MNWTLISITADVIRSHLEFYFALVNLRLKHAIRKYGFVLKFYQDSILRFDGELFKTEPSSNYQHKDVNALGIYKEQPFVTGSGYGSESEPLIRQTRKRKSWIILQSNGT